MFDTPATVLRMTDRRRLLGHLEKLGVADPDQRAEAAFAATQLLHDKGLDWCSLLPVGAKAVAESAPLPDWRNQAMALAHHAAITAPERTFLLKLAGWKAPGGEGMMRLNAIAERVAAVADGSIEPG